MIVAEETDLDGLFKRLHLANARRVWRPLVERAERESWAYRDFLALLATEEIAHRQQTRLARLTRRTHFPFLKTIDDFNFTYQSSLRLHMLGSALAPDFVTEGRSLILAGKPGRGKTHLAIPPTARFRTASTPSSRPPRRSSTTSQPPFAPASWPPRCPRTRIRRSSSSTKSDTSPMALTPPTCSFTSSTSGIDGIAR
jgi:hypothetical protein